MTIRTLTVAAFFGLSCVVSAEIFEGLPDVIICEIAVPDQGRTGRVLFYLDSQEDGGMTRFTSLGAAPMQIAIGPDGTISDNNLTDCTGKSVVQLRNNNQAFDLDD